MGDIEITIESFEHTEDGICLCKGSHLIINGERVVSNGNHIQAVLEYLGYNANVYYN